MNEIDPNFNKVQPVDPAGKGASVIKKPVTGDQAFRKLLDEQIELKSVKPGDKENISLPELSAAYKARQIDIESTQIDFAHKLNTSLELLDSYAAWLADPEKSLKQTRSILDQLVLQTASLDRAFSTQTNPSVELTDILSRLKTTIQVELIKFDRGDYL